MLRSSEFEKGEILSTLGIHTHQLAYQQADMGALNERINDLSMSLGLTGESVELEFDSVKVTTLDAQTISAQTINSTSITTNEAIVNSTLHIKDSVGTSTDDVDIYNDNGEAWYLATAHTFSNRVNITPTGSLNFKTTSEETYLAPLEDGTTTGLQLFGSGNVQIARFVREGENAGDPQRIQFNNLASFDVNGTMNVTDLYPTTIRANSLGVLPATGFLSVFVIGDLATSQGRFAVTNPSGTSATEFNNEDGNNIIEAENKTVFNCPVEHTGNVTALQYRIKDSNDPSGTAPDSLIYRDSNVFELVSSDKIPLRLFCGDDTSNQYIVMYPPEQIDGSTFEAGNTLYVANAHKFTGNTQIQGQLSLDGELVVTNEDSTQTLFNSNNSNENYIRGTSLEVACPQTNLQHHLVNGFIQTSTTGSGGYRFATDGFGKIYAHFSGINYSSPGSMNFFADAVTGQCGALNGFMSNYLGINYSSPTTNRIYLDGTNGHIYYSGQLNPSSDDRLKINERPISDAKDTIENLNFYEYEKVQTLNGTDAYMTERGVIAQELKLNADIGYSVSGSDDTRYSVAYQNIFITMAQAVKELIAENRKLRTDLDALTARVAALEP